MSVVKLWHQCLPMSSVYILLYWVLCSQLVICANVDMLMRVRYFPVVTLLSILEFLSLYITSALYWVITKCDSFSLFCQASRKLSQSLSVLISTLLFLVLTTRFQSPYKIISSFPLLVLIELRILYFSGWYWFLHTLLFTDNSQRDREARIAVTQKNCQISCFLCRLGLFLFCVTKA